MKKIITSVVLGLSVCIISSCGGGVSVSNTSGGGLMSNVGSLGGILGMGGPSAPSAPLASPADISPTANRPTPSLGGVQANPDGLGEVLMFPFYNVNQRP